MKSIVFFFRRLKRQKFVSGLAIGSLSIGMAVVLLIGLWVMEEFNFDKFHKNYKNINQIVGKTRDIDMTSSTHRQLGDAISTSVPEIKAICRISTQANLDYRVNNSLKLETKTMQAENNFFQFFSFPLIHGDAATCLDAPGKMVITESIAQKWFPGQEPLGQIVTGEGMSWQVTGVIEDIPYNSSIQADIIIPFYGRYASPDCIGDVFSTYVEVPATADREKLEKQLTQVNYEMSDEMEELGYQSRLLPLEDVHFSRAAIAHGGNKSLVMILAATALAILLIACINFMNLFIATSFLRVKEISVRKTFGAGKGRLAWVFFEETLSYVLVAGVIAIVLAMMFLPLFNRLADYQLSLSFDSPFLYIYLLSVIAFTFLVAGAYPAFYMTRFGVVETLGQFRGRKLSFMQNALLALQFTVSIAFLIMIFFVHKQVNYIINYDLGYDKENIVYASIQSNIYAHYDAVREELLKNPGVKDVSLRCGLPFSWSDGYPMLKSGSDERIFCEICRAKPNLLDMLGVKFVMGENPFYNTQQDNSIVIDELAVERLGLQEPIGATLEIWGMDFVVKGVVRTVKNKGMKFGFSCPIVYTSSASALQAMVDMGFVSNFYLMCKVVGNPQPVIKAMEEQWKIHEGDMPCTYGFLDEAYQKLYESDSRLGNILTCAMSVMMLLSLCGLFAMAYYKIQRQIKEVGIRKVNGATVFDLLVLLNKGFVRLVLISFLVAGVIAYYFASYWLESFDVRTSLSWWVFVLAGIIALAVTLLTVCSLTLKTIRMNPVDTLRSE